MPMVYKVLGQVDPTSTSTFDVYTVPAATQAVISTIVVCNRSAANGSYNVAVRKAGAALSNAAYIAYNAAVPAFDTIALTLGLSLGNTDVITVQAGTPNNVSFSVYGTEIT